MKASRTAALTSSYGEAAVRQHLAEFFALFDSLVMHSHERHSSNLQSLRDLSLSSALVEQDERLPHQDNWLADETKNGSRSPQKPLCLGATSPSDASTNGAQLRANQYTPKADNFLLGPQTTSITQHTAMAEQGTPLLDLTGHMATFPVIPSTSVPRNRNLSSEVPPNVPIVTERSMGADESSAGALSAEMQHSLVAQGCHSPESSTTLSLQGLPNSSFASVHFLGRQVDSEPRKVEMEVETWFSRDSRLASYGGVISSHPHHVGVSSKSQAPDESTMRSVNASGVRPVDLRRSRSAFPERRATFPDDHGLSHKESGVSSQTTCSSSKSSASSCNCGVVFDAIRTLKHAVVSSEWWAATAGAKPHPVMNITTQSTSATHHTVPPSSILRKQGSVASNPFSALRGQDDLNDRAVDVTPVRDAFATDDASVTRLMREWQIRVVGISSLRAARDQCAGGGKYIDMLVDFTTPAAGDLNRSLVSCAFGRSTVDIAASSVGTATAAPERPQADTVEVKMLNEYLILGNTHQRERGKLSVGFNVTNNSAVVVKEVRRNVQCTRATLQREVAVIKQLRHENIVPVLEVLENPNSSTMYLVTPYMDCRSIATIQRDETRKALPVERVLLILHQAARGLEYLHSHGVVHGDVTPDNILMDSCCRVVLDNCGERSLSLSKDCDESASQECGGPAWWFLSPEQLRAPAGCASGGTTFSDVWSLAATMLSLLLGTLPFGSRSDIAEATEASVDAAVSRAVASDGEMSSLLRLMLSPNPASRPCASDVCLRSKSPFAESEFSPLI